ncbi:hypothetical protein CXB51_025066 [Gossypium anomalum]|uniref:PGG domain-containing protein n=1 Tax=Gossypium anomalum TaxID=47600 RepID=A0A8J5YFQ8_9ROSI|nr:hypothetical protein CXB51_025066 [Gossypium anomalum]
MSSAKASFLHSISILCKFPHLAMDERMIGAAQTGDINILYELILNDPYVLQRIDDVPFFHTALHVAASAGHIDFMMEMINLKPSFARKLNQAGFSPMHLALQNDRTQAVLRLLRFDKGLVRVKGREGFTPLHHVVRAGNVDLLVKFLEVCPEAIEDVTVRDETVFHLAVNNDMFEAFQVLVGWLIRSPHESAQRWEKELLSWANIDGNTVLHVAAIRNKPLVVKALLERLCGDHINAKNAEGLTALDIPSQYALDEGRVDYKESIKDMISKAGGLSGSSSSLPKTSISSFHIEPLKGKVPVLQKIATIAIRGKKGIPYEMPTVLTAYLLPSRSISLFILITLSLFGTCYMLLVAVSIRTLTFQYPYYLATGFVPKRRFFLLLQVVSLCIFAAVLVPAILYSEIILEITKYGI